MRSFICFVLVLSVICQLTAPAFGIPWVYSWFSHDETVREKREIPSVDEPSRDLNAFNESEVMQHGVDNSKSYLDVKMPPSVKSIKEDELIIDEDKVKIADVDGDVTDGATESEPSDLVNADHQSDQALNDDNNSTLPSVTDVPQLNQTVDENVTNQTTNNSTIVNQEPNEIEMFKPLPCPFFTCDNGRCVQGLWRCDLMDDCGDNSDEKNCDDNMCKKSEFRCPSGKCIPENWYCDQVKDCPNGEDEDDC